jgi:hypothetical protein
VSDQDRSGLAVPPFYRPPVGQAANDEAAIDRYVAQLDSATTWEDPTEPGYYWVRYSHAGVDHPDWEVACLRDGRWWLTGWGGETRELTLTAVGTRVLTQEEMLQLQLDADKRVRDSREMATQEVAYALREAR